MSTFKELVDALIQNAYESGIADGNIDPLDDVDEESSVWIEHKERNAKTIELHAAILAYDRDLDDTVPAGSVMVAREVWDTVMADLIYGKRFSPARIQAIRQAVEGFPPSTGHAPGSG